MMPLAMFPDRIFCKIMNFLESGLSNGFIWFQQNGLIAKVKQQSPIYNLFGVKTIKTHNSCIEPSFFEELLRMKIDIPRCSKACNKTKCFIQTLKLHGFNQQTYINEV